MKTNTGFSLLEILIAMAILIIGVAAVVNLFPIGLNASKRAADFTAVGILAQEKMAEAMYVGYDNLASVGLGVKTTFSSSSEEDRWRENYMWYMGSDDAVAGLKKITLWIYWNDRGVERSEPFITYIADYTA